MKTITIPFTPHGEDGRITEESVRREAEQILAQDYTTHEVVKVRSWSEGEPAIIQSEVTARVGDPRT